MPEYLPPWYEVVRLHPDVEAGRLAMATFAIDFGGVLANSEGVPLVYRDSRAFWQATHLTGGIRRLLEEVLDRLSGTPGDRGLQLRSPFGGGKSHVLGDVPPSQATFPRTELTLHCLSIKVFIKHRILKGLTNHPMGS